MICKALSIRQPFAWLIVNGFKNVENRKWSTLFRGRVFIHAGKAMDPGALEVREICVRRGIHMPASFEMGGIVGMTNITGCVKAMESPWFVGPYGFTLEDSNRLPFIPLKGALGFFNFNWQNPPK